MNKSVFLSMLRKRLSGLPEDDISERLAFFGESIDDRMEEGLSEEAAVSSLGTIEEIAMQIISETPLTKIVKKKLSKKKPLKTWEIVLLTLGSPLWLSLGIAALVILFSLFVSFWSVIASLWVGFVSLCVSAIGGVVGGFILLFTDSVFQGIALIGAAMALAGLSVFAFFGCKAISRGTGILTKKICLGIKNLLIRKEKRDE